MPSHSMRYTPRGYNLTRPFPWEQADIEHAEMRLLGCFGGESGEFEDMVVGQRITGRTNRMTLPAKLLAWEEVLTENGNFPACRTSVIMRMLDLGIITRTSEWGTEIERIDYTQIGSSVRTVYIPGVNELGDGGRSQPYRMMTDREGNRWLEPGTVAEHKREIEEELKMPEKPKRAPRGRRLIRW